MKSNSQSQSPNNSYIRLFHALPTADSFDCYLDEKKIVKDLLFEDFTDYKSILPGEHHLTLCAYQSTEPLYERNLWISEHKIYTLVLTYVPSTTTFQGYLLNEPHKNIPEDHFLMRCANFSQQICPMGLHLPEIKPVFKKVPLRQTTPYLGFTPTTAPIELIDTSTQDLLLTSLPYEFKISRYYTLYMIGGTEDYPLKCIRTIDGNSFLHFE